MIEHEHPEVCEVLIDGKSMGTAQVTIDADTEEEKFTRNCNAYRLELLKEKSDLAQGTKTTQAEHD